MDPEALLLDAVFFIDADPRTPGVVCLVVEAPDVTLTLSEDC
jgi:hypothetical protein